MVSREPKKSRREESLSTSLSLSLRSPILEPRRGVCEDRGKCARVRVRGCVVDVRAVRPQESAEKRMARSSTVPAPPPPPLPPPGAAHECGRKRTKSVQEGEASSCRKG